MKTRECHLAVFLSAPSASHVLIVLGYCVVVLAGCSTGGEMEKKRETKAESHEAHLSKHNFRVAEKDGYKIEVWTLTRVLTASPIEPGFRIYVGKGDKGIPPNTSVRLSLRRNIKPNDVREAVAKPELKKTAVEGGYWETTRDENSNIISPDQTEKFTGADGIWEINLDDPFKMSFRKYKEKANYPAPGKYTLTMEISIQDGPRFVFDDLKMEFRATRDPNEKIE